MSTKTAPECLSSGCMNTTWSDSGMCFRHEGRASSNALDPAMLAPSIPGINQNRSIPDDQNKIREDLSRAFPDLDDDLSTDSIRDQSESAVRAAIGTEAYRRFREVDHEDPAQRGHNLTSLRDELSEEATIREVSMDGDDAELVSRSSDDRYGRGYEDSISIASYGVVKEWELARSRGERSDRYGVPYGSSRSAYCRAVTPRFREIAESEYNVQVGEYPRIIKESTGDYPKSEVPIFAGQNMRPSDSTPDTGSRSTPSGGTYAQFSDGIRGQVREDTPWIDDSTKEAMIGGAKSAGKGLLKGAKALVMGTEKSRAKYRENNRRFTEKIREDADAAEERKRERQDDEIRRLQLKTLQDQDRLNRSRRR